MSNVQLLQEAQYSISAVPTNKLYLVWEECVPHLMRVVEAGHGDITLESVRNEIVSGQSQLLCITDGTNIVAATVITVKTLDSGKRILSCHIIGGDGVDEWGVLFLDTVRRIGKEYLCDELRGVGRRGWTKKWKEHGVKDIMTIYKLEL